MKKFLFTLVLCLCLKLSAQDPQLFDTTWNLHELNISDNIIVPPSPSFESIFNVIENNLEVVHQDCEDAYFSEIIYDGIIKFDIIPETIIGLPGVCGNPDLNEFMFDHYGFYGLDNGNPTNSFNYTITEENSILTLTITNGNDDVAVYRNVPLSVEENSITKIELYYNSSTQKISFTGIMEPSDVKIYDLTGKQHITSKVASNQQIDINQLSKGIYIIKIENSENSQRTFKMIKY